MYSFSLSLQEDLLPTLSSLAISKQSCTLFAFFTLFSIAMLHSFFEFLTQYNVVGMAIWLLIAVKVWDLVKWLIDDLVTPLILNPILTRLKIKDMEQLSYKWILYGKVISRVIDFLITAFLVFLVVKYMSVSPK